MPGVSYVMPVLNEVGYIESAVHSILDQEYPGPTEIVLALGPSTDGTNEVVARLAAHDPRIRTVDNPQAAIPSGLNLAIASSLHPVIARVDAHSQLPAGYTRRAVETLLRVPADNVGGIMSAVGRPGSRPRSPGPTTAGWASGAGRTTARTCEGGPAESAYLGVMRASALADIGGYDETLLRGEDWEMNHRLREAGHVVWLDPALHVTYWPRGNWTVWPTVLRHRHLARRAGAPLQRPSPACASTRRRCSSSCWSCRWCWCPLGVAFGGWLGLLALAVGPADLAYVAAAGGAAVATPGSLLDRAWFARVLATMHLAWGAGFLRGVTHGGRHALDRSRPAPPLDWSRPVEPALGVHLLDYALGRVTVVVRCEALMPRRRGARRYVSPRCRVADRVEQIGRFSTTGPGRIGEQVEVEPAQDFLVVREVGGEEHQRLSRSPRSRTSPTSSR